MIEGLEERQLLSGGASHAPAAQAAATTGGVLSAKGQVFRYVTSTGGIATIRIVGVGSLAGTTVDSFGALDLVYGGTNVYLQDHGARSREATAARPWPASSIASSSPAGSPTA